jgi:hypothetical protein
VGVRCSPVSTIQHIVALALWPGNFLLHLVLSLGRGDRILSTQPIPTISKDGLWRVTQGSAPNRQRGVDPHSLPLWLVGRPNASPFLAPEGEVSLSVTASKRTPSHRLTCCPSVPILPTRPPIACLKGRLSRNALQLDRRTAGPTVRKGVQEAARPTDSILKTKRCAKRCASHRRVCT